MGVFGCCRFGCLNTRTTPLKRSQHRSLPRELHVARGPLSTRHDTNAWLYSLLSSHITLRARRWIEGHFLKSGISYRGSACPLSTRVCRHSYIRNRNSRTAYCTPSASPLLSTSSSIRHVGFLRFSQSKYMPMLIMLFT